MSRPIIGRRSRPDRRTWPSDAAALRAVLPGDATIDARVPGIGDHPKTLLARISGNWRTWPCNGMPVRDSLNDIEFHVYWTAPRLPGELRPGHRRGDGPWSGDDLAKAVAPTFKDAAIYAEPERIVGIVHELHGDWSDYLM